MKLVRIRSNRLAAVLPKRPAGYLAELEQHIVKRDDVGVWVDADSPAYQAMRAKYAPARVAEKAVPRDKWPPHIRKIAESQRPGDRGVGDTFARLTGVVGAAYKVVFKAVTGHDCDCNGRQVRMNEKYPYGNSTTYS